MTGRWTSRRAAAAALAVLAMAMAGPRPALAGPQPGEDIDTLAGEPQPLVDFTGTAMQPFGLSVETSPACFGGGTVRTTRSVRTDAAAIQFPACDTLFVADPVNYVVRELGIGEGAFQDTLGNGGRGLEGDGGSVLQAQFSGPYAVAPDSATGDVFIADTFGNQVRAVVGEGIVEHVAGSPTGAFGSGGDGGPAATAGLASPFGIARSPAAGVTYVADTLANRVRAIADATGTITTVAGTGEAGYSGDGGPGTAARLNRPRGLAVDTAGALLIADTGNSAVRRLDPRTGTIATVAGTGAAGFSGDGGPARLARLDEPAAVAVDSADGTIYIADTDNHAVRAVAPTGVIRTFAGTGGVAGASGDGGPATAALLRFPFAVAVLSNGDVVVGDTGNSAVRVVENGVISTFAGNGTPGHGSGVDQLSGPTAAAVTPPALALLACGAQRDAAPLLVLDTFDHALRVQCTAGAPALADAIGDGHLAPDGLAYPLGMAVGGADVFVADTFHNSVRVVRSQGPTPSLATVAGTGQAGFAGDGGPAANAQLSHPGGVAVDGDGNLYIADTLNNRIRRVDATTGTITTIAGTGVSGSQGDGGPATAATLFFPEGVAVDAAHDVYVADTFSHRVRRIDAATGVIRTIAGTGQEGFADGAATTAARFDRPWAVAVDATPAPAGPVVYVADSLNHRLRVVSAGTVATLAGTGARGLRGDQGPVAAAEVNGLRGVTALDSAGTVLVADSFNDRVRRLGAGALTLPGVTFPATRTGLTSTASTVLTNSGRGFLRIASIVVTGATFTRGSASGPPPDCVLTDGLRPGQSCSIGAVFGPTAPVTTTGSVRVIDDSGRTVTAVLRGTGIQPALELRVGRQRLTAPFQLTFDAPNSTTTLTIANTGTAPLGVVNIRFPGASGPFSVASSAVSGCASLLFTTIDPGGSCSVDVRYTIGQVSTTLTMVTDDGPVVTSNLQSISLVGQVPVPAPSPSPVPIR